MSPKFRLLQAADTKLSAPVYETPPFELSAFDNAVRFAGMLPVPQGLLVQSLWGDCSGTSLDNPEEPAILL
jgi:hypothetical protein